MGRGEAPMVPPFDFYLKNTLILVIKKTSQGLFRKSLLSDFNSPFNTANSNFSSPLRDSFSNHHSATSSPGNFFFLSFLISSSPVPATSQLLLFFFFLLQFFSSSSSFILFALIQRPSCSVFFFFFLVTCFSDSVHWSSGVPSAN